MLPSELFLGRSLAADCIQVVQVCNECRRNKRRAAFPVLVLSAFDGANIRK